MLTCLFQGLKDVADISSGNMNDSGRDGFVRDGFGNLDEDPRSLQRFDSFENPSALSVHVS